LVVDHIGDFAPAGNLRLAPLPVGGHGHSGVAELLELLEATLVVYISLPLNKWRRFQSASGLLGRTHSRPAPCEDRRRNFRR
jgi:hypothetical protein